MAEADLALRIRISKSLTLAVHCSAVAADIAAGALYLSDRSLSLWPRRFKVAEAGKRVAALERQLLKEQGLAEAAMGSFRAQVRQQPSH